LLLTGLFEADRVVNFRTRVSFRVWVFDMTGTPEWDERVTDASLASEQLLGLHVIYSDPEGEPSDDPPPLSLTTNRLRWSRMSCSTSSERSMLIIAAWTVRR
jgi:hypothetical protein